MKYFYITDDDGHQLFDQGPTVPKGWNEVPRMPEPFERFDTAAGQFVKNIDGLEQAIRAATTREIHIRRHKHQTVTHIAAR